MGKGIALQFKQAYPANFLAYARVGKRGEVQAGRMFVVPTGYALASATGEARRVWRTCLDNCPPRTCSGTSVG